MEGLTKANKAKLADMMQGLSKAEKDIESDPKNKELAELELNVYFHVCRIAMTLKSIDVPYALGWLACLRMKGIQTMMTMSMYMALITSDKYEEFEFPDLWLMMQEYAAYMGTVIKD
jgi:hypothetical protein